MKETIQKAQAQASADLRSLPKAPTGIHGLDEVTEGGLPRGRPTGTGKSTVAAQFCDAACRRGERALYFAFEESEAQIVRNMASVGMDLGQWVSQGLLHFKCVRPSLLLTEHGIEVADVHRLGEKEVLTGAARLAQDLERGRGHAFSLDVAPGDGAPVAGTR